MSQNSINNKTDTLTIENIQGSTLTSPLNEMLVDTNNFVGTKVNSAFLARLSSTVENVAGDNVDYTVEFNDVLHDLNSDYDTTNHEFTAPVDGVYTLGGNIQVRGLTDSHTYSVFIMRTTSFFYASSFFNAGAVRAVDNDRMSPSGSVSVNLDAGDTASIDVRVSGGSRVVDVFGASTDSVPTLFYGQLEYQT